MMPKPVEPELPGTGSPHPAIDWLGGEHRKLEGQQRVLFNAGDAWKHVAMHVLRKLALSKQYITADDFHLAAIEDKMLDPHHPNAIGALFRYAGTQKLLRRTKETKKSVRNRAHSREIRIWESLIWTQT